MDCASYSLKAMLWMHVFLSFKFCTSFVFVWRACSLFSEACLSGATVPQSDLEWEIIFHPIIFQPIISKGTEKEYLLCSPLSSLTKEECHKINFVSLGEIVNLCIICYEREKYCWRDFNISLSFQAALWGISKYSSVVYNVDLVNRKILEQGLKYWDGRLFKYMWNFYICSMEVILMST